MICLFTISFHSLFLWAKLGACFIKGFEKGK
jgi:hypothetical protein